MGIEESGGGVAPGGALESAILGRPGYGTEPRVWYAVLSMYQRSSVTEAG